MSTPLIGRDRELAELRAALAAAGGGAGRLVLLVGEAGIGKTRLAAALGEMAAEIGVPVARGHAVDDPGMPPLWPWRRVALDVPALDAVLADPGRTDPDGSASARFAMLADAADALVAAAAPAGLVVVLEDLHWADRTSLRLLAHLARELTAARLLVVGTCREATGGLPDLVAAPVTRTVRLGGLSERHVLGWVQQSLDVADPGALAARLARGTDGNPLYLRMLLERIADTGDQTLAVEGHPELRRLVLARLDQLSPAGRELLDAAAVLGERIEPAPLATVFGEDAATVGVLLDRAAAAGLLNAGPGGELAFTHALVRDAVYHALAPSVRSGLHRRWAEALSAGPGAEAGRVAAHWRLSDAPGAADECSRWAGRAAKAAVRVLAYDEAVEFATLALDAGEHRSPDERAVLGLELAKAQFLTGDMETTLAQCRATARLAEDAGRPDLLAETALVVTGAGDPVVLAVVDQLCDTALRRLPTAEVNLRARLLAQRAMAAAATGAGERGRELSAQAMALVGPDADPDAELDGIHARHLALCAPQFLTERAALAHRAVELGERAAQPLAALWGHVWLVDAGFQAGDLAVVDRELDRIEQVATAGGHRLAWWHLHRLRATKAALQGRLATALELNETARAVAERIGMFAPLGLHELFRCQVALVRGTIEPAFAEQLLDLLGRGPDLPLVRTFVPLIHALRGDFDQARATFEEFRGLPPRLEVGLFWGPVLGNIGIVATLLGDGEVAASVYSALSTVEPCYLTDGSGAAFCAGASPRMLGDLARTCGRHTEAVAHYRLAAELNARIGARPFLALSRLGQANALTDRGDPADLPAARDLTGLAAAEFRRLDLPGPLAEADRLLRRLSEAEKTANPLTPRETEVHTLLTEALTNREIARRLTLSERTVETHVRNILGKLGLRTRTEIAARPELPGETGVPRR